MATTDAKGGESDGDGDINLSGTTLTGEVTRTIVDSQEPIWLTWLRVGAGYFYGRCVEHAPPGSWSLRLWSWFSRVLVRHLMMDFYHKFTDFTKRLRSFKANEKFETIDRPFGDIVKHLKQRFQLLELVYCWHAMPGYWGGVTISSNETQHLNTRLHQCGPTPFIQHIEPSIAWDPISLGGLGAVPPEKSFDMYKGIHGYLKDSGVDGVKVDAQAGVGTFGEGVGGGPALVREATQAMERSVTEAFGASPVPHPHKRRTPLWLPCFSPLFSSSPLSSTLCSFVCTLSHNPFYEIIGLTVAFCGFGGIAG